MKTHYKVALGVVFASWATTGAIWLQQKNSRASEERLAQESMRTLQNSNQPQWGGGMRQRWLDVPQGRRKIITGPIVEQLNAFRNDDYNKAVQYQSTALRHNFTSTAMFRAIIRRSYPEFADYETVTFGRARMDPQQKRYAILTMVTGKSGKTSRVIYFMINEDDKFLVDGVARARDRGRFSGPPAPPGRGNGPGREAPPGQRLPQFDRGAPGPILPPRPAEPAVPMAPPPPLPLPDPGATSA